MSNKHLNPRSFVNTLSLVRTLPQQATEVLKGKYACWKLSRPFHKHRRILGWNEATAQIIRNQVDRALDDLNRYRDTHIHLGKELQPSLTDLDHNIIHEIQIATTAANQSNITRTQAYLHCYESYPELHWALLAHMVSRNGGWKMSDLKGGLMADLTDGSLRDDIYRMLERCNALIFQDAYPQLQLYMHSRQHGCSFFHLLEHFHVSTFMNSFWSHFWLDRNSALLAVGLIINEQHYIEDRVIQQPFYQKKVFQSSAYKINHLAHVNQILFPLNEVTTSNMEESPDLSPSPGLVGLVLENFKNIDERINLGKSLYGLLFGYSDVLNRVTSYATSIIHQGSRSEYWPHLFTTDKETAMNSSMESSQLLDHEWLSPGQRIYSPVLNDVWFDMPYDPIPRYDWLKDKNVTQYISKPSRPILIEMSHDHRAALQKTALAHDIVRNFD
ncbi:DUF2515 family protein [Paenibacillus sp. FA6]|uniref:DUF2515 family protein n=1 Tax=Paenibacillus sp. FA6 TaxID=3413029 RepID=UPI003F65B1F6